MVHTKRDSSRSTSRLKATKKKSQAPLVTRESSASFPSPDQAGSIASIGAVDSNTEQSQSALISRLPYDVRSMIYEEVLCRPVGVVHITTRKDGKMVHFRCKAKDARCRGLECFHDSDEDLYGTWRTRDKDLFSTWNPSNTSDVLDGGLIALLQSCRQV